MDNVEFVKGYIEEIPLADASVDVVISNCVINLSADKRKVLSETARVLRPGGRFAVSDVIASPRWPRRCYDCLHNAGALADEQALSSRRGVDGHRCSTRRGITPAERVHPAGRREARRVELAEEADVVVTMGCGDECPYIPGRRYLDWDLDDPKGRPLDEVRATRDDIDRRVRELVEELDA